MATFMGCPKQIGVQGKLWGLRFRVQLSEVLLYHTTGPNV